MELNMKNINIFIGLIAIVFVFSSCEDVIKVKVDQGPERLVIDAFVNNLKRKASYSYNQEHSLF